MRVSPKLKWIVGAIALAACVTGWTAVGLVVMLHRTLPALTAAATFAALATEGLFWTAAAILGITVVESRRRIFAWLTRPFARRV